MGLIKYSLTLVHQVIKGVGRVTIKFYWVSMPVLTCAAIHPLITYLAFAARPSDPEAATIIRAEEHEFIRMPPPDLDGGWGTFQESLSHSLRKLAFVFCEVALVAVAVSSRRWENLKSRVTGDLPDNSEHEQHATIPDAAPVPRRSVRRGELENGLSTLFYHHTTSRRVVMYHHGNGETLHSCMGFLCDLACELQCSVFAYDYPGYGASSGCPTEASVIAAAKAAYAHVTGADGLRFAPADVVLLSWSIGSGPAVELAATVAQDVAALLLMSPFRSCGSVGLPQSMGGVLGRLDLFRNERKLAGVSCPLLVIHGPADWTVPQSHGRALVAAAKRSRHAEFVEATDYGHGVHGWTGLYPNMNRFLDAYVPPAVDVRADE